MNTTISGRWYQPCNGVWRWVFTIDQRSDSVISHRIYEYETIDKVRHDRIKRLKVNRPGAAFNRAKNELVRIR